LGQKLDAIGFFFSGNKQQLITVFVVFLSEQICRQRVAFVYDVDYSFGHNEIIWHKNRKSFSKQKKTAEAAFLFRLVLWFI
jgi:hypothetical protein